jgi:hypothetical protein
MRVPRMKFAVLVVVFPTIAARQRTKLIGLIDFYGYGSLDVTYLQTLPYRFGDAVPSTQELRDAARSYAKVVGGPREIRPGLLSAGRPLGFICRPPGTRH